MLYLDCLLLSVRCRQIDGNVGAEGVAVTAVMLCVDRSVTRFDVHQGDENDVYFDERNRKVISNLKLFVCLVLIIRVIFVSC